MVTVSAVLPETGPTTGGTFVLIVGTGFHTGALVKFGAEIASGVVVNGAGTEVTCTSPEHAIGAVGVTVQNPVVMGEALADTLAAAFTYVTAPTFGAPHAYCLDLIEFARSGGGWTRWTVPAQDGKVDQDVLHLLDGWNLRRERKDLAPTDYADSAYVVAVTAADGAAVTLASVANVIVGDVLAQGSPVSAWAVVTAVTGHVCTMSRTQAFAAGAATSYRAIGFDVEWLPKFAPPGNMHHFREASLLFRSAHVSKGSLYLETDLSPSGEEEVRLGGIASNDHPVARVVIPRNAARGGFLRVRFQHAEAWRPALIEALRVVYNPGSQPVPSRGLTQEHDE